MTPAQELSARMLTVCYDFQNRLGMVISEPAVSVKDALVIVRLVKGIDPEVMEIRLIPGGGNFAGTVMRRIADKQWGTSSYDTREDFAK